MNRAAADLFLTGAGGFLGGRVREQARALGLTVASSRDGLGRLDLETPGRIGALVRELRPALVIHAAAIPDIRACAAAPELALRVNRDASLEIAEAAAEIGAHFVFVSTDQVFDGRAAPYDESATPRPLHHYGATKAAAEDLILRRPAGRLVLRIPLLIGASGPNRRSASDAVLDAGRAGRGITLFRDEYRAPAEAGDLAAALLALGRAKTEGLLHLGGPERLSRYELGLLVAARAGLAAGDFIQPALLADHPLAAERPADLDLDSRRAYARLGRPLLRPSEAIA